MGNTTPQIAFESAKGTQLRQSKYVHHISERDHRTTKRIVKPIIGFTSLNSARRTLSKIEAMNRIGKKQVNGIDPGSRTSQAECSQVLFEMIV